MSVGVVGRRAPVTVSVITGPSFVAACVVLRGAR